MAEGEQDGGKSACSLGFHLDRKRYLLLRPEQFSQLCVERSQLKIALNRTQDSDHKVN